MKMSKAATVDAYIAAFPQDVQETLKKVRHAIREVAPEATETISYGIPTFKINGAYFIYFAGFKNHISVYPIFSSDEPFKKDLAPYLSGKGTAKFPLDKPIPLDLIRKIAKYKLEQRIRNQASAD